MHALIQRVEAEILQRGLGPALSLPKGPRNAGGRLLVAVSGGVDSMVLLAILRELAPRHGWVLSVAHANHGLRGRSSQADERWVRTVCQKWSIPCIAGAVEVKQRARRSGISVEMAAREARHIFLARVARQKRIETVVLGHHADDQVELFLLRLLRGSSSLGLAGMKWSNPSPVEPRVTLVRPLLGCSRAELSDFASREQVPFREDATNASVDILRNRIRHELVPLLQRRFQPALQRVLLREAELLGAEAALISELASTWQARRAEPFGQLPLALQRAVLRAEAMRLGLEPDFELVEALRANPRQQVSFSGGLSLVHDGEGRVTAPKAPAPRGFNAQSLPVQFSGRGGHGSFGGLRWTWRITPAVKARPAFAAGSEWFDAEKVGGEVLLRHWAPGDRFQPCGARFTAKLQDLFTNQKVPGAFRKDLVVAATKDGRLWWVEGLRIGEAFKLSPTTRVVLHWSWQRQALPRGLGQAGADLGGKDR